MNKFKKKNITLFIIFILIMTKLSAQEFNQFYSIPLFYNSAFAGIGKCSSVSINNNIHPVVSGVNFISNDLLLDIYVQKFSGGLKFDISRVSSPNNIFSSLNFALGYAYHNKFSKNLRFSMSLQAKYNQESFSTSNLIFPNMISPYSNVLFQSNEMIISSVNNNLLFAGGAVLYGKDYYFSFFVDNLFQIYFNEEINIRKNFSLLAEKQLLKLKNKYQLKVNSAMYFSKYYQNFSTGFIFQFQQAGVGLFALQNIYNRTVSNGLSSWLSYNYSKITIAYSYSFFLGDLYKKRSATHEIHLKLRFKCGEKNNNNTIICPAYKL